MDYYKLLEKKIRQVKIISLFLFCISLISCVSPIEKINDYMGWKDDNIVEETTEYILKKETDIDLDFTPRSEEHVDKD